MKPEWEHNTKEQMDLASQGKLCPKCGGTDIKYVGNTPDGLYMNSAYDCETCGEQWEGY